MGEQNNQAVAITVDAGVDARDFAGTLWTDGFFRVDGVRQVVIETKVNKIMLDADFPNAPYGNKEAEKRQSKYISDRRKEGWRFAASWGYAMFIWEGQP